MRKNARCRIGNLKNTQKHFLILIMGAIYHTARSENCVLRRIFLRYRMWVPGCKVRLLPSGRVTSAVRLQGTVMV